MGVYTPELSVAEQQQLQPTTQYQHPPHNYRRRRWGRERERTAEKSDAAAASTRDVGAYRVAWYSDFSSKENNICY